MTQDLTQEIFGLVSELIENDRFIKLINDHRFSLILQKKLYWDYEGVNGHLYVVFDPQTQQIHYLTDWLDELNEKNLLSLKDIPQRELIRNTIKQILIHVKNNNLQSNLSVTGIIIEIP